MPLQVDEVKRLFDRARSEMFIEPASVNIDVGEGVLQVKVQEGSFHIKVPSRLLYDPEGGPIILWYFRHNLAHLHYCPYNLRTVQTLARAAYDETKSWAHSHNAVRLFADLQIDLFYLPLKYMNAPLHLVDEFASKPKALDAVRYAAYTHFYKDFMKKHNIDRDIIFYGSLIAEVVLSPRSWISKVKFIASILKRLQFLELVKKLNQTAGEGIPLSEDLEADFSAEARKAMSGLSKEEARELYRHWLKERLNLKGAEKELKEVLRQMRARSDEKGVDEKIQSLTTPRPREEGEEPELPSRLSKPLAKILGGLDELMWKSLWYRAKAEEFMITYSGGKRRSGTWAVYAYTDLWTVEDDLEELDLEATFEEGPLIPEETTLKGINMPSPSGEVLVEEKAPSVLIVLDTSRSMVSVIDEATIAAFTAYLSAKRAGGKVSVINFSTRYVSVGWDELDLRKELVLAILQGELTILPLSGISERLKELESDEKGIVILVTDCGWQNLREAVRFLENIASKGHKVVVFHVEGWRYPRSVETVAQAHGLTLYKVRDPSMLKHLVLTETIEETPKIPRPT
ncbi:MAG: VWA domain-containing protein [Thermofilaceae archaeon]|nr:VWA domain-containing protein [Thermofilaceae archaeon]MCX8180582.1 VWA domain-containing protein [Thermofilaceae archaeon]MDW8003684.1 vWA domain-containing protein [Thermofilaceae archaeon]